MGNMEHRQLIHFVTVAEQRSFTAAARICFISQQGLSDSVRKLEEQLEVPLFSRSPLGIELTEFGRALYHSAKPWIKQHDQIVREIRRLRARSDGQITVALTEGFYGSFPRPFFGKFAGKYPETVMEITCFPSASCQASMIEQHIALGFSDSPVNMALFDIIFCKKYPVMLLVRNDHALAGRGQVSLEDLRHERIIAASNRMHPASAIAELCASQGINPRVLTGIGDMDLLFEMAATGSYAAFWAGPGKPAAPDFAEIPVRDFENIFWELNFIHNRNVWLNSNAKIFIEWAGKEFM